MSQLEAHDCHGSLASNPVLSHLANPFKLELAQCKLFRLPLLKRSPVAFLEHSLTPVRYVYVRASFIFHFRFLWILLVPRFTVVVSDPVQFVHILTTVATASPPCFKNRPWQEHQDQPASTVYGHARVPSAMR